MNEKIIFVNATSATVGGTLTIVNQFIKNIDIHNKKYYIFVPINFKYNLVDNVVLVNIEAKKYFDRIKWDLFKMKKWAKLNNINPDLIISLQNTNVLFGKVPQIAYLHQPLPYAKESIWNVLKKDERKMWFYKYLYKIWINKSIKKEHYIIVQTRWMKEAVIRSGFERDKILISKPSIKEIDVDNVNYIDSQGKKMLFYPAADYKYKNHDVIVEAIRNLVNENKKLRNEIKVIFTLDKETSTYKKILKYELEDVIYCIGNQKYEDVLRYFKSSNLILFPSYIETFGLPLIEASIFGKKILVADCSYSREVLDGYNLVEYIKYDDVKQWSKKIKDNLCDYKEFSNTTKTLNGWNEVFKLIDKILK